MYIPLTYNAGCCSWSDITTEVLDVQTCRERAPLLSEVLLLQGVWGVEGAPPGCEGDGGGSNMSWFSATT